MPDSPNENIPIEQRRQIFRQELEVLREKKLIPKTDYIRISNAYDRHVQQVMKPEDQALLLREKEEYRTFNKRNCNRCRAKGSIKGSTGSHNSEREDFFRE